MLAVLDRLLGLTEQQYGHNSTTMVSIVTRTFERFTSVPARNVLLVLVRFVSVSVRQEALSSTAYSDRYYRSVPRPGPFEKADIPSASRSMSTVYGWLLLPES